jgi:hypothetical protein
MKLFLHDPNEVSSVAANDFLNSLQLEAKVLLAMTFNSLRSGLMLVVI